MTATAIRDDRGRTMSEPRWNAGRARQLVLACGALSSLLYVATDVLGGLSYPGYSFVSQAISELGALGAPSKPLVDPLFLGYDALALIFAVGVFREGAERGRALRITGALLIAYATLGLLGGAFFNAFLSMRQRGVGNLSTDAPHIVLTGVIVLLLLGAIGAGAFALAKRFRAYSLATLATVIGLTVVTALYAARLAAGEPTRGMGIIERLEVYSLMLWLAVLGIALQRRPSATAKPPLP
jgi:hypothetical membrane protein